MSFFEFCSPCFLQGHPQGLGTLHYLSFGLRTVVWAQKPGWPEGFWHRRYLGCLTRHFFVCQAILLWAFFTSSPSHSVPISGKEEMRGKAWSSQAEGWGLGFLSPVTTWCLVGWITSAFVLLSIESRAAIDVPAFGKASSHQWHGLWLSFPSLSSSSSSGNWGQTRLGLSERFSGFYTEKQQFAMGLTGVQGEECGPQVSGSATPSLQGSEGHWVSLARQVTPKGMCWSQSKFI